MPTELEETQRALAQFRIDILKALTNLSVEIEATQNSLIDAGAFDAHALELSRLEVKKNNASLIFGRFASQISSAHELR